MTHDHAAYMRRWRAQRKERAREELAKVWDAGLAFGCGYDLSDPDSAAEFERDWPHRRSQNPYGASDVSRGTPPSSG